MHAAIFSSEPPENACARIRIRDVLQNLQPAASYTWAGIIDSDTLDSALAQSISSSDVAIVQRSFPRRSTLKTLDALLFKSNKPVIYETDDLLTELPLSHPEHALYAEYRNSILSFIANCDALIVSTTKLRDHYRSLNPNTYFFPNSLNRTLWFRPISRRAAQIRRQITIGFCGSHTHQPDLEVVEEALKRVATTFGERVRFSFFGCITKPLQNLGNVDFHEGFVKYSQYPDLLRSLDFDIGLAPLVDNDFNAKKSSIKYLEYAASGIAGIYSDVTPYSDTVKHGETGMLVENSVDTWYATICRLIADQESRIRIATAAHDDVWSRFSLDINANHWLTIVEEIVSNHKDRASCGEDPARAIAKNMWAQTINYERMIASMEGKLAKARDSAQHVTAHPFGRVLSAARTLWRRGVEANDG